MDIKFIFVLFCSFKFISGNVEKKLKKLRGDPGEESDEDEDIVRIQWEGNGNFGKKFSVLSDINSAESGIPLPILQPPFFYYSSSIHDFERENPENRGRVEGNSREGNRSDSVGKLRIYEITSGGGREDGRGGKGKFGEEKDFGWTRGGFGKFSRLKDGEGGNQRSSGETGSEGLGKGSLERWGNFGKSGSFGTGRNVGNLGEFDNNENVRKLNENFGSRGEFDGENFGNESRTFGNESGGENMNGEFGENLEQSKSNFENSAADRKSFGNFGNESQNFGNESGSGKKNGEFEGNLETSKSNFENLEAGRKNFGNFGNEKFFNLETHQNFRSGPNLKVLKEDESFGNWKSLKSNQKLENPNFGYERSSKIDDNSRGQSFENGGNLKIPKVENSENEENWKIWSQNENLASRNFGNSENLKVLKIDENFGNNSDRKSLKNDKSLEDQNFESGRNSKIDENSRNNNFEKVRNLKVLKIDENFRSQENYGKQSPNFGNLGNNPSLKVLRIDENFGRFSPAHVRTFGNSGETFDSNKGETGKNFDPTKSRNVQILTERKESSERAKTSEENFKNKSASDDSKVQKPPNLGNQEQDSDVNQKESGAGGSEIWDPSRTFKKLRPAQSLSVIKTPGTPQLPRGNRKYQNSGEVSDRRNFEFPRSEYLRRKIFQSRVNHFRYLDENSKFGAIPGVPGRDYPVNTEYNLRATKKFLCPAHSDTHIYIADRSSRCQVFYVCYGSNSGVQMVCPDGTLFNQQLQVCDWWFNVTC